jgi:hypothetical protein
MYQPVRVVATCLAFFLQATRGFDVAYEYLGETFFMNVGVAIFLPFLVAIVPVLWSAGASPPSPPPLPTPHTHHTALSGQLTTEGYML